MHGIVPPLVTPLTSGGEFDSASYAKLIERVIAGGVHGLFVMGSTGEFTALVPTFATPLFRKAVTSQDQAVPGGSERL